MLEKLPTISLVFVNYNSSAYLAKAIESIASHEDSVDYEVIIVNNDVQEKQSIAVLQEKYKAKLIETGDNIGFAGGVNRGVSIAAGSVIGLLNPDTLWTQKQLEKIQSRLDQEDCLIGISLFDGEGKREKYGFGKKVHFWQLIKNHLFETPAPIKGKNQVDWVSGGALFFRRSTFESLAGFDERYFLYYEDVDFCERARRNGRAAYVYEDLRITHFRGKSQKSPKKQKKEYYRSQQYYFQKMRPRYEQILLKGFHFFLN